MEKWERMARSIVEDWRANDGGLTAAALDVIDIGRSLDADPITSWEAYEWANQEGTGAAQELLDAYGREGAA